MIFSGVMLIVYCINGRSPIMSLDLQYKNSHWLILKNIQEYICPRKLKLAPERYKKHPYIHVRKNPRRGKSGQRLMCLNSSGLRSTDNIKFDSNSVDMFFNICVTVGATPFKHDFLPNTFVQTIENMEGSGRKLTIHGYGSSTYRVQTDNGSMVKIKVKSQPFVPNLKCFLLAPKQIGTGENNNGLPEHEHTQMKINAFSSVLPLDKKKTKTIMHR